MAKSVGVILMGVVVILGLVVEQMEAKTCCPDDWRSTCYKTCRVPCMTGGCIKLCAAGCGCEIIRKGTQCPPGYVGGGMLEEAASVDLLTPEHTTIAHYCKLGCESSACNQAMAMITINHNTGEAKEAMEHCKNACSEFCNNKAASEKIALA